MDTKRKVGVGVLATIILGLVFFGGASINDENAYYCEARSAVANCDGFSVYYSLNTGKFLNAKTGNKLCRSGWVEIEDDGEFIVPTPPAVEVLVPVEVIVPGPAEKPIDQPAVAPVERCPAGSPCVRIS